MSEHNIVKSFVTFYQLKYRGFLFQSSEPTHHRICCVCDQLILKFVTKSGCSVSRDM